MSQTTARHDPHANAGDEQDEQVAYPRASQPEHKRGDGSRRPVGQPPGDGGVTPDEPDEPEFDLIGDDDLSPADLGPAAPNITDPDQDSGRLRKITT
ncbi:MAG: hypothetical protein ABSA02_40450 [Trebonia sp.]|jgi:hypothetical protein